MRERLMRLLFKREVKNSEEYIQFLLKDIKYLIEMQDLYEDEIKNLTNENRVLSHIVESVNFYKGEN